MTKTKKDKETAVTADTRAEDTRAKVYEQPVVVNMVGKTVAAPQVLLNDRDKMYMATAKKTSDTMTFVYSLVCPRTNGTYYEMIPSRVHRPATCGHLLPHRESDYGISTAFCWVPRNPRR